MREDKAVAGAVDWADLSTGTMYVRDKKLNSMIEEFDFVDAIFHTWLQRVPTEAEKRMLNAVLVSFCGGWGIIPPVVFSARIAATTKAPIAQCLAAGFSASGPSHTSAIDGIMQIYLTKTDAEVEALVNDAIANNDKIPGFGHPVVPRDPRPQTLRNLIGRLGLAGDGIRKFDIIQNALVAAKDVYANIDGVNGAILVDLGFHEPSYGPALFLMGRSLAITAHVLEEYKNPPFHALNLVYPGYDIMDYEHRATIEAQKQQAAE